MFDTTVVDSNGVNTFLYNNSLDSSIVIATGTVAPGTDLLLSPTDQNQLGTNSSFDLDLFSNQTMGEVGGIGSEVAGSFGTELFLFDQQESNTLITPESTNPDLAAQTPVSEAIADVLIGTAANVPLVGGDWFDQNIKDLGLRLAAKSYFSDGVLNRNDMIAIFRDAEDGDVINGKELTDLRAIVNNGSLFNMPNHVQVLSNKIAKTNVANAYYQGAPLGNLHAGSSATHMENLISKWFLGADHPDAGGYTYQYAEGSLFQNGISYQDVNQGAVGDCYLMAGLATTAFSSTTTIENMFIDNGDDTYTVRFYKNGVADYVTVDKYLPTTDWGTFVYAHQAEASWGYYNNPSNELWVALAEKAYAQLNESGWIGQDNTNSYQGINGSDGIAGGYLKDALKQITGLSASSSWGSPLDFNSIVNNLISGKLIGFGSGYDGQVASNIVPLHVYPLVGYDASAQTFTLYNPWGVNGGYGSDGNFKPGTLELTWSEITESFLYSDYTTA